MKAVIFSASLNDGGNGHTETKTFAELGIDEDLSDEEQQEEVTEAYNTWLHNFNMGGWEVIEAEDA